MNIFILSLICTIYFGIAFVAIHFFRRDLSVTYDTLSRYAIGRGGWVLTIGFYSMGISEILVSVSFTRIYGTSIGTILLFLAGIAFIVVAIFKMDISGKRTFAGYVHTISAIVQFLFYPVALLLLNKLFENQGVSVITFILGIITLTFFGVMAFLYYEKCIKKVYYFGIIEKLNIFFMITWMIYVACVFI